MPPSDAFDPVEFKRNVRTEWRSAAPGWHRWMDVVEAEEGGRRHSDTLIRLAELRRGAAVLDVGGGYGEPSLTAARAVGPGGRVVCTDISPEMLNVARERASDAGITNIEFVVRDAEDLGFDDASFDAVLSRATLLHRRQQPPDGCGEPAPGLERSTQAPQRARDVRQEPPDALLHLGGLAREQRGQMRRDVSDELREPLRGLGLEDHRHCAGPYVLESRLPHELGETLGIIERERSRAARRWRRQRELLGDDRERRGELRVTDAYRPFQRADGRVRTENRAIWVTGVR